MVIPLGLAIGAALAGTGMQMYAQNRAARRAADASRAALERQRQFQRQAEQRAMTAAEQFQQPQRQQAQTEIEQQLTQRYQQPQREAAPINDLATRATGEVSDSYEAARAQSQANTQAAAERFARLLARTGAAQRLRFEEGLNLSNAANDISRIANFAQGQHAADQLGIHAAGQANPWLMLGGQLLSAVGTSAIGSALTAPANAAASTAGTGLTAGAGGIGLKPLAGAGTRLSGGSLLGVKVPSTLFSNIGQQSLGLGFGGGHALNSFFINNLKP